MDISKLQFRDKNPRLIKAENLEKLKKSIQDDPEFLAKRKILVNDTKDGKIVYAGNQRLRSLLALGYTEVPDEWIDVEKNIPIKLMEKRAFKDNVEYGEYDHDKLKDFDLEFLKELDLPEWELDLSELNDIELDEDKEDSIPEPAKVAKLVEIGDIIQLWPHRIMCGDSTDKETVDTLMDGKKADMVFTDPPYGIDFESNSGAKIKNDNLNYDELQHFNSLFQWLAFDVTKDDCFMMVWQSPRVLHLLEYFGQWTFFRLINMYKSNRISFPHWMWINKTEPCVIFKKGSPKISDEKYIDDTIVYVHDKETHADSNVWHPTPKPVPMICDNIIGCIKEWDMVLDLFLWSGSTLMAAEKTGRICYGQELDPVYIEVIIKRYHDYTKWARDIKCLNRDLDLSPILKDEK